MVTMVNLLYVFYTPPKKKIKRGIERGKRKINTYHFAEILWNLIDEVEMTRTLANYISFDLSKIIFLNSIK